MSTLFLGFYPIDGYERTKIARLLYLQRRLENGEQITRIPQGALHNINTVRLNLTKHKDKELDFFFQEDPEFSSEIRKLIPKGAYSLTALDMSDPENLKYAAYNEDLGYQPGSVGKLAVLIALFTELDKIYPGSWEEKEELLRNRKVAAGIWGTGDHHTIPVYDIETDKLTRRKVVATDVFSIYEWIDHMVSVSNNGAATVVFRSAKRRPFAERKATTTRFEEEPKCSVNANTLSVPLPRARRPRHSGAPCSFRACSGNIQRSCASCSAIPSSLAIVGRSPRWRLALR